MLGLLDGLELSELVLGDFVFITLTPSVSEKDLEILGLLDGMILGDLVFVDFTPSVSGKDPEALGLLDGFDFSETDLGDFVFVDLTPSC